VEGVPRCLKPVLHRVDNVRAEARTLPELTPNGQGITSTALDKGTPIDPGENVSAMLPVPSGLT
jgi:hypothetical protein